MIENMIYPVTGEIRTAYEGFDRIIKLRENILSSQKLSLDFSKVDWFDANMCAPLGAILHEYKNSGREATIINILNDWLDTILRKNGFLKSFGRIKMTDTYQTTIRYQRFTKDFPNDFMEYVTEYFRQGSKGLPEMTPLLLRRFRKSLFEIHENAREHSESDLGFFACGQYFPRQNRLDFCMADLGIGIRRNVKEKLGLKMTSQEAIEWAMEGNTTKRGPRPGGLGLKLIREFIKLNNGKLILVSDRGFWHLSAGRVETRRFENSFPGTVVSIEINTADTASYCLSSELDPSDIF